MKKLVVLAAAIALMIVGSAATADEHLPEHPHILVIGVGFDETGEPVSVRNCVDLAANQALPLHVQHQHMHFGRAGEAMAQGGNFVVPAAPFPGVPWTDCESFRAIVGL